METPTNPILKVYDIRMIAAACKAHGALLAVDNTFMSPVNQNPLLLGADICMQSMTKYCGGHSDLIAGSVCVNSRDLYEQLNVSMQNLGTGIDGFNAWLAMRSCKTIELRV